MPLWKNSRYLNVDDSIAGIDPKTLELKNSLGVRLIEQASGENSVHVVKSGENIFDIAVKYYDDARLWWKIADANRITLTDPYNLDGIRELLIPI